jgi:hypothetical protein
MELTFLKEIIINIFSAEKSHLVHFDVNFKQVLNITSNECKVYGVQYNHEYPRMFAVLGP